MLSYIQGGRPDVMKLVKEVYASWQAEVVFITSNFQGNKEIMEGCKESGIPAFVRYIFTSILLEESSDAVDLAGHSVGFLKFILPTFRQCTADTATL